jgi:Tfp pilus assembly protein FimT
MVELMVIVTIIVIMAGLAAPGMMRAMSINRAQRATVDVARLGRAARSDAISFGRTYLLRHVAGASGRGRLELWRGITDTCRTTPWATVMVADGCTNVPPAPDCVDSVDMDNYSTSSSWVVLTSTGPSMLCFEPDDELWTSTGGVFTEAARSEVLRLQRFETGGAARERRGVVFPPVGAPRTER